MKDLGKGKSNQVINLDLGAKNSGSFPYFGVQGFAAPSIPQFAEVSPGYLVYQSKKYRDEAKMLYASACTVLDQTEAALELTIKSSQMAEAFKDETRANANASKLSEGLCQKYLGESISMYNMTFVSSEKTRQLAEEAKELETISKKHAYSSASSAELARMYLNDTRSKENALAVLALKVTLLEKRIHDLEGDRERS